MLERKRRVLLNKEEVQNLEKTVQKTLKNLIEREELLKQQVAEIKTEKKD